ncbi:hypothetical protein JCM8097_000762 [Rhodosporidiobolus ruineniae]
MQIRPAVSLSATTLEARSAVRQNKAQLHRPLLFCLPLRQSSVLCAVAKFFASFMFLLSTLGVNISANSISFATDITGLFPRYLTILRSTVAAGILTILINPWQIVNGSSSFYHFINAYPCFLAPIACIMFTDFFIVRRGKLHVEDLYDPNGPFW